VGNSNCGTPQLSSGPLAGSQSKQMKVQLIIITLLFASCSSQQQIGDWCYHGPFTIVPLQVRITSLEDSPSHQSISIEGVVLDSLSSEPVGGASVWSRINRLNTLESDSLGRFSLTGLAHNDTLIFALVGYEIKRLPLATFTEKERSTLPFDK
jgi:hypothetical protein